MDRHVNETLKPVRHSAIPSFNGDRSRWTKLDQSRSKTLTNRILTCSGLIRFAVLYPIFVHLVYRFIDSNNTVSTLRHFSRFELRTGSLEQSFLLLSPKVFIPIAMSENPFQPIFQTFQRISNCIQSQLSSLTGLTIHAPHPNEKPLLFLSSYSKPTDVSTKVSLILLYNLSFTFIYLYGNSLFRVFQFIIFWSMFLSTIFVCKTYDVEWTNDNYQLAKWCHNLDFWILFVLLYRLWKINN